MSYEPTGVFAGYERGGTHFARRLAQARRLFAEALDLAPAGPVTVLDICGGEGQVVLPVIAAHPRRQQVDAVIVELDPPSVECARARVDELGLERVTLRQADAGLPSSYAGLPRAHVLVLSGVLFHLSPQDRAAALIFLRQLSMPDARMVWTAGAGPLRRLDRQVRRFLREAGFTIEQTCDIPRFAWGGGTRHVVGLARLVFAPEPLQATTRVFAFRPDFWRRHPGVHRLLRPVVRTIRQPGRPTR